MDTSAISVSDTVVFSESDHASLIRTLVVDDTEGTTAKKKGNRRKSGIWSLFTAVDRDFALCNLCDIRFSYRTSISNLKKHLLNKHSVVPPPAKLITENDTGVGSESSERNIVSGCERVLVKKEKNTGETPNRGRMYLDDCVLDASNIMRYTNEKEMRDEFDAIGVTIAAKLRKMDERQRLFCEKIINEALFKGAFEQLCPTSELVVYHSSSSPVTITDEQEFKQAHIREATITINTGNPAVNPT